MHLTITTIWKAKRQKKITTNDANLKTVDIMLKYDLVTPKTVEQSVILDKLKGIKGIESVIEEYK